MNAMYNKRIFLLTLSLVFTSGCKTTPSNFSLEDKDNNIAEVKEFHGHTSDEVMYSVLLSKAFPDIEFEKGLSASDINILADKVFKCESKHLLLGYEPHSWKDENVTVTRHKKNDFKLSVSFYYKKDQHGRTSLKEYSCVSNNSEIQKLTSEISSLNEGVKEARLADQKAKKAKSVAEIQKYIEGTKAYSAKWYNLSRGGYAVQNMITSSEDMRLDLISNTYMNSVHPYESFSALTYNKVGLPVFGLMINDVTCKWAFDGHVRKVMTLQVDNKEKLNFEYSCLDARVGFAEVKGDSKHFLVNKFKKQSKVVIDGRQYSAKGFTSAYNQWKKR